MRFGGEYPEPLCIFKDTGNNLPLRKKENEKVILHHYFYYSHDVVIDRHVMQS